MAPIPCQHAIRLGDTKFKVVNLTEPLRLDVQVFPGDPKPERTLVSSFDGGGCLHYAHLIGDHNFHPHGDGPNHQNRDCKDKGFDSWGLNMVFNKACLIDLTSARDAVLIHGLKILRVITAGDLEPYRDIIKKCGALVVRTGYDKWLEANRRHLKKNIPYFDRGAVDFIASFRNLKVVGTDSLTVDDMEDSYAHRTFKDRLVVECLVNLYRIPKKNRMNFDLQTSPIAIAGATGGPILAYAYIPER